MHRLFGINADDTQITMNNKFFETIQQILNISATFTQNMLHTHIYDSLILK